MTSGTAQFIGVLHRLEELEVARKGYSITVQDAEQARADHYAEIKVLMQGDVDVNAPTGKGITCLIALTHLWEKTLEDRDIDSAQACLDIILHLLDHGADINSQDLQGRTPLMIAISVPSPHNRKFQRSSIDDFFAEQLIERGARLDPVLPQDSAWPTTPLILAVSKNKLAIFTLLLSKGVNVNTRISDTTALLSIISAYASSTYSPVSKEKYIDTLIEHGASVKADSVAILAAAISHYPGSVERFMNECYGLPEPDSAFDMHLEESKTTDVSNLLKKAELLSISDASSTVEERGEQYYKTYMSSEEQNVSEATILCRNCRRYEIEAVHREWFFHSTSSECVRNSISEGCVLCQMIWDMLPDTFQEVMLYYYSAFVKPQLSETSRNYQERIIVRARVPNNSVFGELRLATLNDDMASLLSGVSMDHDGSTRSEATLRLLKQWMLTCASKHAGTCQSFHNDPPPLPTRVVDVGLVEASTNPRLFVSNGQRAHYTTLSYCWGARANLRVESDNLKAFQTSIPFSKIPKTIQEAIEVTRRLGIRYLWVDTLCILQDSIEDWLHEAKNMASIYKNSLLTITAADSIDSEGGLFRPRQRLRTYPVRFAPAASPFATLASGQEVFVFADRQESNDAFRPQGRLDTRGWVLQEQLISPRTVSYSSQEIYWDCPSLSASESYPEGIPRDLDPQFEHLQFSELKLQMSAADPNSKRPRTLIHELWQKLVGLYSRRELTIEADKLVALAGVANQISKALDDRLLAGLWVKYLWRDLLWWGENSPSSDRPAKFTAPSWSWASINGTVSYRFPDKAIYHDYYSCIQILKYEANILSLSNSISGSITVRGGLVPITLLNDQEIEATTFEKQRRTIPILQRPAATSTSTRHQIFWIRDTREVLSEQIQVMIVAASKEHVMGLGLLPTGRTPGEYRRVGLASWEQHFSILPEEVTFQEITLI